MTRGGWASDFARRASEARKTWDLQRAQREVRELQGVVAGLEADARGEVYTGDAADLGEGTGVDARAMIARLAEKDAEAKRVQAHRAAQRVARALGDGSELAESDGTRLFRFRTELKVPVPR